MAAIERQMDSIRSRYATQSSRSPRQAINSAAIPEFVLGLCFAECRPVSDRELLAAQPARSQRRGRGWPPKLSGSQVRGSLFLTAPFIERVRGLTPWRYAFTLFEVWRGSFVDRLIFPHSIQEPSA
jgi:hypothetical protein